MFGLNRPSERSSKYLHWDKLRFMQPPSDLSHEEWWAALKLERRLAAKRIPLRSTDGGHFQYVLTDTVLEGLHEIDTRAGSTVATRRPLPGAPLQDRYLVSSLIEEAITSSQLEGAVATREDAKKMIRSGRKPRDHSERMILNNYGTMQHIRTLTDQPLTKRLVQEIHSRITRGTLEDPEDEGRFRAPGRVIEVVGDDVGQVFHVPPHGDELDDRMVEMCRFANGETPRQYLPPALRAMMLHFWLAYDHPFVDGNGRTARALFYWCMLRNGFWLCEYISISEIIRNAPAKYGRAFLYTETDDNDLTYFLLYHLEVIRRAIEHLHEYVRRKTQELQTLERHLSADAALNHRQRALLSHALRHPHQRYTFDSHRISHDVAYQTARTDLLDLTDRGFLLKNKVGREWNFLPVADLEANLREC